MPLDAKVLVVDDDAVTRACLVNYFVAEGYEVRESATAEDAEQQLAAEMVDLVLLDIRLPRKDGLTLTRELRVRSDVGIILVSGRQDEVERIIGLECGADEYVTKPFNPRELLARVKSLLRRTGARRGGGEDEEIFRFAGWTLNLPRRRLCDPQGADVALTRGEFEVLALLVRHVGEVINRDRLSRAISGHDWSPQDRTVDVLVRRLRAKLDAADKPDSLITTVRGEGYRLAVDVERAHG